MKIWLVLSLLLVEARLGLSSHEQCPAHDKDAGIISGSSGAHSECNWTIAKKSSRFFVEIFVIRLLNTQLSLRDIRVNVTAKNKGSRFTLRLMALECVALQAFGGEQCDPPPCLNKLPIDPDSIIISVDQQVDVDISYDVVSCDNQATTTALKLTNPTSEPNKSQRKTSSKASETPQATVTVRPISRTDRSVDHLFVILPLIGALLLFAGILAFVICRRRKKRGKNGELRTPISMSQISQDSVYAEIDDANHVREEVQNVIYSASPDEKETVVNPVYSEKKEEENPLSSDVNTRVDHVDNDCPI